MLTSLFFTEEKKSVKVICMEIAQNIIKNNISIVFLVLIGLEIIIFFILAWIFIKIHKISVKSKEFFSGKNGKNLEEMIFKINQENKILDKDIQELYNISNQLYKNSMQSIRKVKMTRFNPFKDVGGEQSFSAVWLDGKNSGLVISSLHTKEGTRMYAKTIENGKSLKYPLTEEEKMIIQEVCQKK